jgi:hypothetical protein
MYLGLDLGTGLTKLASTAGQVPPSLAMRPTAVSYRGLTSEIPADSSDEVPPDGAVRCDGFPAMLDGGRAARRVAAWQSRTPGEVSQGFLRCLLEGSDRTQPSGQPTELVVAVPPAERGSAAGPDSGTEVRDILIALGWAPRRLVAAPVASLLQLRRDHPGLAAATRFAVCDTGAGSARFALCTADQRGIRVTDSIRLDATLAWSDDTPRASDRSPTLAEYLVAAITSTVEGGKEPATSAMSVRRWRALERSLGDGAQRERLDAVLQQAAASQHRHGSTVALRFADLEVTAGQLLDACAPLAERLAAALGRLLARQDDPGWLRFGDGSASRIVLTGGLDGLHPLRSALLTTAGLDPAGPGRAAVEPGPAGRLGTAARGAALIAAGEADPGDRYPYAVQVTVHRSVRDRVVTSHLELAAAGSVDLDRTETVFLNQADEPVLVTVPPGAGPASPLLVRLVRDGAEIPAVLSPARPPSPGAYRVGVRGGPGGPAVVLEPMDDAEPLVYLIAEAGS